MYVDQIRHFAFKNTTGETIPPFGVVVIENAILEDQEIVFNVRKCTQQDEDLQEPAMLLFNGIQPVDDDSYGSGTRDFPLQAMVEQPSTDHPVGTVVGPKAGTFVLAILGSCLRIMAKDATDSHFESGHGIYFIEPYHGKTDFHIAIATSAISAASGSTLGTGNAMLKRINSSGVLVDDRAETIKNPGSAIASGATLVVWRSRKDYVAVEICP